MLGTAGERKEKKKKKKEQNAAGIGRGSLTRSESGSVHDRGYFQRIQRLFHAPLSLKGILRETV